MTVLSNTEYASVHLKAVKGDTIDIHFHVNYELTATGKKFYISLNADPENGSAYTLGTISMQVRRKDSLLLKDWISGVSPSDIVVSGNEFHLYDADGFLESGLFDYDIEEFDAVSGFKCIAKGMFGVQKEITI